MKMNEHIFQVGNEAVIQQDSPAGHYSACFEDDGETGYFYALDLAQAENGIVDAVHIYNVANVADRERPSTLTIVWSADSTKCALLINGYPHAAFDFVARRGYCRTNLPNLPPSEGSNWSSDHRWSNDAVAWLVSEASHGSSGS